ncbi:Cyclin-dependent kinase inhibitor [Artemisia annua]|uniref:Cyclin-dependent kinase inhibitor n=1 Tax=Artemisia annua TaxID=35608 RepID=A0A2U1PBL8_ARTAN|nr:Cyclin-dependent kinase inhibitor [Artemisia annua]
MGKYIRGKSNPKVSTLDISQSSGVRTRAKTLALKKLQTETPEEMSYLQLRSRRLEKTPLTFCRSQNPNPNPKVNCCTGGDQEGCFEGENNIGFDAREQRSTRESTPCNSIKDMNVICTPGSSTRPRNLEASNRINQNSITRIMPLAHEIEDFFARHEQAQQRRFADKYNFDIVNENPLEGRYEWVRVQSQ